MKWQSVGNSLMVAGVLGLVAWIGYEKVRMQAEDPSSMFADEDSQGPRSRLTESEALPGEVRYVEMTVPLPEEDEPQIAPFRVQFSKPEWEMVKQRAQRCNLPVTAYVREKLLDPECPQRG